RHDDQIFENPSGVAGLKRAWNVAVQAGSQIGAAVVTEGIDDLAGAGIDGGQESSIDVEQTPVGAVFALPVVHTAGSHGSHVRMDPQFFAGGRVQGGDGGTGLRRSASPGLRAGLATWRWGAGFENVHNSVDHNRVENKCAGSSRITPNHF